MFEKLLRNKISEPDFSKIIVQVDTLKENYNVFAYYVIKTILIHNFQDFLSWCQTHNTSLLQFNK